jgi:hypothetical protein
VENEVAVADWDIHIITNKNTPHPHPIFVIVSALTKTPVRFKDKLMVVCYGSNFSYIFALFLAKYLSIDCLSYSVSEI